MTSTLVWRPDDLARLLAAALAAKQSLARLGTRPRGTFGRRIDAALIDDMLRVETEHLIDRLHRLVGRMGAAGEPREPVRRAIVETGAHQLHRIPGGAQIRRHIEAAQLALALVRDEVLARADPRPGDDAALRFAHHGLALRVADRLPKLALVEGEIGHRIVGERDFGDLALELRDRRHVLGPEPPQHDP